MFLGFGAPLVDLVFICYCALRNTHMTPCFETNTLLIIIVVAGHKRVVLKND